MPSKTRKILKNSPLHKKICERLEWRVKMADNSQNEMHEEWRRAEESMVGYMPTSSADRRRETNRDGGIPQYTTIVIPYSYAVAMASYTYWTSVFYARNPIYQFSGRHGEGQQQVQAVEAIIDYQVQNGQHLVPGHSWLFDNARYGFGVLGTHWEVEERHVVSIYDEGDEAALAEAQSAGAFDMSVIEDPQRSGKRVEKVEKVMTYEGNKVYNVNPFDWLPDPRVPMQNFQKGEFVAVKRSLGWNQVIYREQQGYYMNVDQIKTSVGTRTTTHNSDAAGKRPEHQYFHEEGLTHPSMVHLYEVYVELIPSEWDLAKSRDFPEKWVFTVTQDLELLIGATPLGAYHCRFPFDLIEMEPDAYTLSSRGIPTILQPVQDTMNWLLNSHFYNIRSAMQNLFIADPSRVNIRDLEDPLPGGVIRVRDTAMGSDIRTAIHQVQIQDYTREHLRDLQIMQQIGERIVGVNDQILGAQGGAGDSRKTATEIRTTTSFGINRLKSATEYMSAMGIAPHAKMLVQNTQQYYDAERMYRIAGSLGQEGQEFMNVTSGEIEGFYDFVPVDGALPIDRLAQLKLWQELMLQVQQMPSIAMQYNFGRLFEFVASLGGVKNLGQFKFEIQPDEQVLQQAQMGNLIGQQPGQAANRTPPLANNSAGAGGPIL